MASVFGHSLAAIALGNTFKKHLRKPKFWILGITCSIAPDADVLGFRFGIPYDSFWGHRGFTHSFFFAVLLGILVAYVFYSSKRPLLATYFALCTASHPILDAMTTGGRGVAFFSPFENSRYFLPWRNIKVSPIRMEQFFGEWGIQVIQSELVWIGIPFVAVIILIKLIQYLIKT